MDGRIKTVLLLGVLTGLLLIVGGLLGGSTGLTIALIFSLIMNFGTYWFSDKIILFIYRAKEADKKKYSTLYRLVNEVSEKAGIPMPKVYIVETETPNAFATGRSPKHAVVAATTGILALLNENELRGVIAHEISHIKHYDTLIQAIAATIAGVISYLAMMARYAAIFGGMSGDDRDGGQNILELLVLAILAPLIAVLLQLAISRSREYMADASAAKTLKNGNWLADALKKLEDGIKKNPMRFGNPTTSSIFIANPFAAKNIMTLFSTHPSMDERIKRLRNMGF